MLFMGLAINHVSGKAEGLFLIIIMLINCLNRNLLNFYQYTNIIAYNKFILRVFK